MKAGLFLCDHVNPEYREKFGDYSDMFVQLFPEFEWVFYDVCNGHFPDNLEECDIYFCTGSRYSVYENKDWIIQLKKTIQALYQRNKYFIGFCFGHQLLGAALGGKVAKSPNGWCIGVHEFEITTSKDWMQPMQSPLNLLMLCQDQIVELPKNSTVLGGNQQCSVGIIQIGNRMLGIQGHPEFSKAYDQVLVELRVDRIGKTVVEKGIKSLEKEVHREVVKRWILGFLGNSY